MRNKKLRGLKRKTRNMIKRIREETSDFPLDFYNGFWHLHLPVAQDFIDSDRTPFGIKRLSVQTLLERANHLIEIKPTTPEKCRVVVFISFQALFDSQIIVFAGDSHFKGFFNRNDEFQKWIPLSKERNIESEWRINIPKDMKVLGFKEEITDEDGEIYKREIWLIGELE
ncbi:DUF3916 domain-containing protein [Sporosarcina luteola]|uniref:DUF3916 domain-containing protein n=1 Tax=Sporosarcina luteola TaxID=582850 RepID=UPI00203C9AC8|nr:DUF3916 domain-containing protein [Sporosarcina luteola]MCM3744311.1 DUF3916 domain-containing protein [Sporosarcina luteola]